MVFILNWHPPLKFDCNCNCNLFLGLSSACNFVHCWFVKRCVFSLKGVVYCIFCLVGVCCCFLGGVYVLSVFVDVCFGCE